MKNAKKENIVLLISQLLLIVVDVVCELPNAKFVSNLIDYGCRLGFFPASREYTTV